MRTALAATLVVRRVCSASSGDFENLSGRRGEKVKRYRFSAGAHFASFVGCFESRLKTNGHAQPFSRARTLCTEYNAT